jgi:glycerol-3-phosphate dehydrogenase
MNKTIKTQVLVIGGGATGAAVLRDLSLRGLHAVLVEKNDMNAGASGANHGLLHSGARYVFNDSEAAAECRAESEILKRTAPRFVEATGGLFIAVRGDDERFISDFPHYCSKANIQTTLLSPGQARELEPSLTQDVIAAYRVNDASVDPFGLTMAMMSNAVKDGANVFFQSLIRSFAIKNGRIVSVTVENTASGETFDIEADIVVNASGAWASQVASLAGVDIPMTFSKGTLLVTAQRVSGHVINRLRPPSDADIIVPGGTVSVLGTTSQRIAHPGDAFPTIPETDRIIEESSRLIPGLLTERYIRAYSGVRPLAGKSEGRGDRCLSRGFSLLDHGRDGVGNFITITGGKLTTCRLMAEKASDLVCGHLGISAECRTMDTPLGQSSECGWTVPGSSPADWFRKKEPKDMILCECEMISTGIIDELSRSIENSGRDVELVSLGQRSRLGKGPCQGAFCVFRVTGHLYNNRFMKGPRGLSQMKRFIQNRFKGLRAVLMGPSLAQAELQEAFQCGLFNLDQQ